MYSKNNKIDKLHLFGGDKTINYQFTKINQIGNEEIKAVNKVMKSGILSDFIASPGKKMYGGMNILNFGSKLLIF